MDWAAQEDYPYVVMWLHQSRSEVVLDRDLHLPVAKSSNDDWWWNRFSFRLIWSFLRGEDSL